MPRTRKPSHKNHIPVELIPISSGRIDQGLPNRTRELLHDLEVHQVELEMQNEELRKTQIELQIAHEKLVDLYDFAPVGYLCVTGKSIIKELNLTAAHLLGYEKNDLIDKPFPMLADRESADAFHIHQRKVFKSHTSQVCELSLRRKDGKVFDAQLESICMAGQRNSRIILSDITQRKQLEREVRHQQEGLERAVQERTRELSAKTLRLEEMNTALKVLLEQRENDKNELKAVIISNVQKLAVPYLHSLRRTHLNGEQKKCLEGLEENLKNIISPFSKNLTSRYEYLTPAEIRIADFIRDGKSVKEIASMLSISNNAVNFHRQHIRNKLNLTNQKITLRMYLLSLV